MYHNYLVAHFSFPHGYGNNLDSIASFDPGCMLPTYRSISVPDFLVEMEKEYQFELVFSIPVRIDLLGESRIDFFFRSKEEYGDD